MVLGVWVGRFIFGLDGIDRRQSQLVVFLKEKQPKCHTSFFPLRRFLQVLTTKGWGYLQD